MNINKNSLISSPLFLLLMSLSFYSSPSLVCAQIIPDNTLGAENSQVKQINQFKSLIEGGAIRGDNLFHSFLEIPLTLKMDKEKIKLLYSLPAITTSSRLCR